MQRFVLPTKRITQAVSSFTPNGGQNMKIKNRIYQFKISLREITPVVWRRIHVSSNYDFWDLHVAIQDSMGWLDYHLHQFSIKRPSAHRFTEIGIPADEWFDEEYEMLPGWEVNVADYFTDLGVKALYKYDFGDGWEHAIELEGLLLREKGVKYPRCIDGELACPPEDCGGVSGFFRFLDIISNPTHDEHEEMLEWAGGKYNPDDFDPNSVRFDNPKQRFKKAFIDSQRMSYPFAGGDSEKRAPQLIVM